jgi:CheY-like chemotaxis protein
MKTPAGRILALEENPMRIVELRQALVTPGHQLTNLSNFYNALDYMRDHEVDLIVCDVHLESASGFEFLKVLRNSRQLRHIAFVFYCINPSEFTKSFISSLRVAAEKLGAEGVIVMEEFDAARLCHEIEQYLPESVPRKCA